MERLFFKLGRVVHAAFLVTYAAETSRTCTGPDAHGLGYRQCRIYLICFASGLFFTAHKYYERSLVHVCNGHRGRGLPYFRRSGAELAGGILAYWAGRFRHRWSTTCVELSGRCHLSAPCTSNSNGLGHWYRQAGSHIWLWGGRHRAGEIWRVRFFCHSDYSASTLRPECTADSQALSPTNKVPKCCRVAFALRGTPGFSCVQAYYQQCGHKYSGRETRR